MVAVVDEEEVEAEVVVVDSVVAVDTEVPVPTPVEVVVDTVPDGSLGLHWPTYLTDLLVFVVSSLSAPVASVHP